MTRIIGFTFLAFVLTLFNVFSLRAENVKSINITGNHRIGENIILSKLPFKIGDELTDKDLNNGVKKLYSSEYFSDISMNFDGEKKGVVNINVFENPVVADVYITGDTQLDADDIKKQLSTKSLQMYSKNKVKFDADGLLNVYHRMGYLNTKIEPKVVFLEDNAVDIIFDIQEGDLSYVKDINFYGNKSFFSRRLIENIVSQKRSLVAFTKNSGNFTNEMLEQDKKALMQFYHSRGFARMSVVNATAGFDKEKMNFILDFYINEGDIYYINNVDIATDVNRFQSDDKLKTAISVKAGDKYNIEKLNQTILEISKYLSELGFANVRPYYNLSIDDETRKIDVKFLFSVGQKMYIDRIKISGNTKTHDGVILRELRVSEGDLYNASSIAESRDRLWMTGYFKNVEIKENIIPNSDLVELEIIVEEQFSGTLNGSVGYSNYFGLTLSGAVQINNIFGRGYNVGLSVDKNGFMDRASLNFFNPYFFGKHNIGFGVNLYGTYFGSLWGGTKYTSGLPYKGYSYGGNLTFSFELLNRLSLSVDVGYSAYKYSNMTNSWAYKLYGQMMGDRQSVFLGLNLTYNQMNRFRYATKGYLFQAGITFSGFGVPKMQQFVKYTGRFIHNWQIFGEDLIFHTEIMGGYVQSLGSGNQLIGFENLFSLGGYQMRGFNFYGIGSNIARTVSGQTTYMTYAIDSKAYYYASFEFRSPLFIPKDFGIYASVFVDIGAAWGFSGALLNTIYPVVVGKVPNTNIYLTDEVKERIVQSPKPRVSVGVGLTWNSPLGAIGIYYAKPLVKQDYDMTMEFGVKIGTQI